MQLVLFLFLLFVHFSVSAYETSFPKLEQIQSLDPQKQKQLIRDLQFVFAEMAEKSNYMAEAPTPMGNSGRSLASSAPVLDDATLQRREKHRLEYIDKLEISEDEFDEHERIALKTPREQRDSKKYKKSYAIWKGLIDRVNTSESKDHWDKYWVERKAEQKKLDAIEADKAAKKALEEAENERQHRAWVTEKTRDKGLREQINDYFARRDRRAHIVKVRAQEKIEKSSQIKSDFRKMEIADYNKQNKKEDHVCMFAGWVIESGPCQAPRKLPNDMKFGDLDPKTVQCEKGKYICNPIIFGFNLPKTCKSFIGKEAGSEKSCAQLAKPICASFNSGSPTQECMSSSFASTPVAVELATKVNPQAFNKYRDQFFRLCNPEMLKNNEVIKKRKNATSLTKDVESTCQIAEKRMAFLNEKYFSTASSVPVNPDTLLLQR